MSKKLHLLLTCFALVFAGHLLAQPELTPPVAIGPQTLSAGFHQFLTQEGSGNGNIKGVPDGIAAGDSFWLYVTGIDASGVTGSIGRTVKFNLQDSETGSQFKHIGISFALQDPSAGGGDLLSCYQSTDDETEQAFGAGVLTSNTFDLRFNIYKAEADTGWIITPFYRLAGGEWTEFFDGAFRPTVSFDFLGAKLVVSFENGAEGQVSFDNYFVAGPIIDPDTLYVDDDWVETPDGEYVSFPGSFNILEVGVNAFASINEAYSAYYEEPEAANKFDRNSVNSILQIPVLPEVIRIAPGTYDENIEFRDKLKIIGSGSGTDPNVDTIIDSDEINQPVIRIYGGEASGSSGDRFEISNLRVTGASFTEGNSSFGSGILIDDGLFNTISAESFDEKSANKINSGTPVEYLYFENVVSDNNAHSGLGFQCFNIYDIELKDCVLSNNGYYGLFIATGISNFDGLTIVSGEISNNGIAGLTTGPDGSQGVTNVTIDSTTFSANGEFNNYGAESNDIDMYGFYGNATIEDLTITGSLGYAGIYLSGQFSEPIIEAGADVENAPRKSSSRRSRSSRESSVAIQKIDLPSGPGTIIFNNINIDGNYGSNGLNAPFGAGIAIFDYDSGLDNILFTDVSINVSPIVDLQASNLVLEGLSGTLDVGNTIFGGNADFDIMDIAGPDVTATSAAFTNATDNFEIEDRIVHAIDLEETGLVTWLSDNVFLTPNSFFSPNTQATIIRAVNAASTGDTVNVDSGTFMEQPRIVINKDLAIIGQGPSSTIFQANGSTTSSPDTLRAWFEVKAGNFVVFHNLRFDGNSSNEYTIHEAVRMLGSGAFFNTDFQNIMTPSSFDGYGIVVNGDGIVDVTNCSFTNIGRTGVLYSSTDAHGSVYRGNTYTGKAAGEKLDYAVEVTVRIDLRIVSSIISNNLGVLTPSEANKETDESNGVTQIHSAGIKVQTESDSPPLNTITIDSCIINYNAVAVGVGDDTSDKSRVIIVNSDLSYNPVGILSESAQYIQAKSTDFTFNEIAVIFNNVPTFDLDFNTFANNIDGVMITQSSGQIQNNIFNSTSNYAVYITDQPSTGTEIEGNEFCDNGIAVLNDGISTVNAEGNYWGASDGPSGEGTGEGDEVSEGVDYIPFETTTLFANSPCEPPYILVETKVFLQGPYDGDDTMGSDLSDLEFIPTTSPYSDERDVETIPENVVDWVYVELWEAFSEPNSANGLNQVGYLPVTGRSAFLLSNGSVVDDDGETEAIQVPFFERKVERLKFELNKIDGVSELTYSYHIVIHHRNHLAIMSSQEVNLSNETSTLYDFTTAQSKAFGNNAQAELSDGNFGMLAGDGNGDGGVDAIDQNSVWRVQNGTTWNYEKLGDFNLDGGIDAIDINGSWRPNNGQGTQLPENPE